MGIAVQHISKTFGAHQALRDVSMEVPDGQLVAFLGPSGCGKTTLLRIIAGLEAADAHDGTSIRFDDRDVSGTSVGTRKVGFVFQHYALFRHMTVFENIAFGLRVKARRERPSGRAIGAKVAELMKLIQLEGFERRYPAQLSGGQRQRVALARALAVEPKVLLLDEPFGALDARVRADLRRWLRRLHDEVHLTSVFVTHDQEEALEVADRIVVMNQGRVEQVGTPDEVFHHPVNAFVADFLGKVNLFHGRVEEGKAVFGGLVVDGEHGAGQEGHAAQLLVRPHELELLPLTSTEAGLAAVVQRIQSTGSMVRVELETDDGQSLRADVPHDRFAALGIHVGDGVRVAPRQTRVLVDDYVI
jgi:sulfate transport system ATP-binding protein